MFDPFAELVFYVDSPHSLCTAGGILKVEAGATWMANLDDPRLEVLLLLCEGSGAKTL